MTDLFMPCGGCGRPVSLMRTDTVGVTKRLVPPDVTYYHPDCHDPWREAVGYGAGS